MAVMAVAVEIYLHRALPVAFAFSFLRVLSVNPRSITANTKTSGISQI